MFEWKMACMGNVGRIGTRAASACGVSEQSRHANLNLVARTRRVPIV